jgi:quinol monooxygenase YgiN
VSDSTFVALMARWTISPSDAPAIEAILGELATASRAEPGCLRYEVYREQGEPCSYVLIERYRDEAALEDHRASEHFVRLVLGGTVPLLRERTVVRLDALTG